MKFNSILLTLAASVTLVSAGDYYCPFAQDNSGMIQQPYCCDEFTDSKGGSVAKEGQNCMFLSNFLPLVLVVVEVEVGRVVLIIWCSRPVDDYVGR